MERDGHGGIFLVVSFDGVISGSFHHDLEAMSRRARQVERSGGNIRGAISQPSGVHMEADQIREYIQAYDCVWSAEASFSEVRKRKQRSKRGWRGALRMLKAALHG